MVFKIADFNIEILSQYDTTNNLCMDFFTDSTDIDFIIRSTEKAILYEESISEVKCEKDYYEQTAIFRKIAETIPTYDAFVLHAASIVVDGIGIAFTANSGTGKTTHMKLWKQKLRGRMRYVNGDKPIIRFFEDDMSPIVYGTPWRGKECYGGNRSAPLKHICFIERSETNSCEPMDKKDAVDLMFNQVYMPTDPQAAMCTMQLIDRLLSSCKLWKIKCNMEPQAAEVAYNTIFAE